MVPNGAVSEGVGLRTYRLRIVVREGCPENRRGDTCPTGRSLAYKITSIEVPPTSHDQQQ